MHGLHRNRILANEGSHSTDVLTHGFGPHHQFDTVVSEISGVAKCCFRVLRIYRSRRQADSDRSAHSSQPSSQRKPVPFSGRPSCSAPSSTTMPTSKPIDRVDQSCLLGVLPGQSIVDRRGERLGVGDRTRRSVSRGDGKFAGALRECGQVLRADRSGHRRVLRDAVHR